MTRTERGSSLERLRLPDAEFIAWWDTLERIWMAARQISWIVEVYRDFVRGRKIIEVGPGAGIVGVQLLRAGAKITFIDVVGSNLLLVERVCRIKGIDGATFLKLNAFGDPLILPADYDAVFAIGSLYHAPSEVTKPEFEALASRLKLGGRFITLTYPRERWVEESQRPFSEWGKNTDGEATPWAEWYDVDKILAQLSPYQFQ